MRTDLQMRPVLDMQRLSMLQQHATIFSAPLSTTDMTAGSCCCLSPQAHPLLHRAACGLPAGCGTCFQLHMLITSGCCCWLFMLINLCSYVNCNCLQAVHTRVQLHKSVTPDYDSCMDDLLMLTNCCCQPHLPAGCAHVLPPVRA
jgi:hypothetical protein